MATGALCSHSALSVPSIQWPQAYDRNDKNVSTYRSNAISHTPPTGALTMADITLIHGARDGNHVLVGAARPSVVTRAALHAACHLPLP